MSATRKINRARPNYHGKAKKPWLFSKDEIKLKQKDKVGASATLKAAAAATATAATASAQSNGVRRRS